MSTADSGSFSCISSEENKREVVKESVVIAVFKKVPRLLNNDQLFKSKNDDEIVYEQRHLKFKVNSGNNGSISGFLFLFMILFFLIYSLKL